MIIIDQQLLERCKDPSWHAANKSPFKAYLDFIARLNNVEYRWANRVNWDSTSSYVLEFGDAAIEVDIGLTGAMTGYDESAFNAFIQVLTRLDKAVNSSGNRDNYLLLMRQQFEVNAKLVGLDLSKSEGGCYLDVKTDLAFTFFSTAHQLQQDVIDRLKQQLN